MNVDDGEDFVFPMEEENEEENPVENTPVEINDPPEQNDPLKKMKEQAAE